MSHCHSKGGCHATSFHNEGTKTRRNEKLIEDAEYKDIVKEWGAPIAVVHSYIEAQDTEIIMKS